MCPAAGAGTQTANIILTSLHRNISPEEDTGDCHRHPIFPNTDTYPSIHVLQEKQVQIVEYSRKQFIQ